MNTTPPRSRDHLVAAVFLLLIACLGLLGLMTPASAADGAGAAVSAGADASVCHVDEETAADNVQLKAQLAEAQATAMQAVKALEVATRVNETKDGQIAGLNEVVQKQIASLAELQAQNADIQRAMIQLRADSRRLTEKYLRANEEVKALRQRVAELEAQLKQAKQRNPNGGEDPPKPPPPAPKGKPVKGKVVQVEPVTDELTLIQLDVGSEDRVEEGMAFIIYRGDQFLGKGEVTTLDPGESVGKLTLGGGVKPGDLVRFEAVEPQ